MIKTMGSIKGHLQARLLDTHFVIPHLVIPSRVHIKGHPLYVPTTAHKVGIQKYPPRHPGETSTHA